MRIAKTYRLEEKYVKMLEEMSEKEHRSLTNLIETMIEERYNPTCYCNICKVTIRGDEIHEGSYGNVYCKLCHDHITSDE